MKYISQLKYWFTTIVFIIFILYKYQRDNSDNSVNFLKSVKTDPAINLVYPNQFIIPFTTLFEQTDQITCGPASVMMVLKAYKKADVTLDGIKKITKTVWFQCNQADIGMTTPDHLALAMNHYDLESTMLCGDIHFLKYQISCNKPCIVLVRSSELTWHYLVVIGYDTQYFYIADPIDGNIRPIGTDIFLKCWRWDSDLHGEPCQSYLNRLLNIMSIYSNTIIFPNCGVTNE